MCKRSYIVGYTPFKLYTSVKALNKYLKFNSNSVQLVNKDECETISCNDEIEGDKHTIAYTK